MGHCWLDITLINWVNYLFVWFSIRCLCFVVCECYLLEIEATERESERNRLRKIEMEEISLCGFNDLCGITLNLFYTNQKHIQQARWQKLKIHSLVFCVSLISSFSNSLLLSSSSIFLNWIRTINTVSEFDIITWKLYHMAESDRSILSSHSRTRTFRLTYSFYVISSIYVARKWIARITWWDRLVSVCPLHKRFETIDFYRKTSSSFSVFVCNLIIVCRW